MDANQPVDRQNDLSKIKRAFEQGKISKSEMRRLKRQLREQESEDRITKARAEAERVVLSMLHSIQRVMSTEKELALDDLQEIGDRLAKCSEQCRALDDERGGRMLQFAWSQHGLDSDTLIRLLRVGRGQLIPQLVFGGGFGAAKLEKLPIQWQRKLWAGGVETPAGWKHINKLTMSEAAYILKEDVLAECPIRTPDEQIAAKAQNRERRQLLTDETVMWFGKYKGEPLREIPDDYLQWVNEQDWCSKRLRAYITMRKKDTATH